MRLYEYEAKKIFQKEGIPIPEGDIATSYEEGKEIFEKIYNISNRAVLKSQILLGGRGKAGGIKFVNNQKEFEIAWNELYNKKIHGFEIKKILIEEYEEKTRHYDRLIQEYAS